MFAESAKFGHEQLCSVDRDQIWQQVKPALKPMWDGQESVKNATSIAAQNMAVWFKANPQ
jgi:hypothetical protein